MSCDPNELIQRPPRTEDDRHTLVFHQGRIAIGNTVIQDGEIRDQIGAKCDGTLCVEMEAVGVDATDDAWSSAPYLTMWTPTRAIYGGLTLLDMRLRSLESCSVGFSLTLLRVWKE